MGSFPARRISGSASEFAVWRPSVKFSFNLAAVVGIALCQAAVAGDWPQILGPARNGIAAADEKLATDWPSGGPPLAWERPVGSGYAGVAVVGDRVFLFHREGNDDVLEALQASTGKSIWKQSDPTTFYPSVGGGDGPLCVPVVDGSTVVTFSAQGLLSARDAATGRLRWKRDTHKEYGAQEGYFGAGSTPLVAGEVVIVNVGGRQENSGIVGFDLKTGETKWMQTNEQASYSAPILGQLDAGGEGKAEDMRPAAIVETRLQCVALEPESGALYWKFPFGQRGPTVNGAVPLLLKDRLFLTASYGIGAVEMQAGVAGCTQIWESDDVLSSQYTTPIEHEGFLYGLHGRDDVPPADLRCIDPRDRSVRWTESDFGYCTLLKADGKLLLVKTNGEIILAEANPERFRSLARFRAFSSGIIRALPALSNGGLYVRNEKTLKRFEVSPR
jgi:hypothetical protein